MKIEFIILWVFLLFFPVMALYWRRWVVFAIYVLGCAAFLYSNLSRSDGWDDLADYATLLVIVTPLYIIASLVWIIAVFVSKRKNMK